MTHKRKRHPNRGKSFEYHEPAVMPLLHDIETSMAFWANVDVAADVGRTDCWIFVGDVNDKGYGYFTALGPDGHEHKQVAHRYAYEDLVGPIPEGLTLDHLCRERSCCNPAHLEPVTRAENLRRSKVPVVPGTMTPVPDYGEPGTGKPGTKAPRHKPRHTDRKPRPDHKDRYENLTKQFRKAG